MRSVGEGMQATLVFERVPERWGRIAALVVIGVAGTLAAYQAFLVLPVMHLQSVGDFGLYLEATRRWVGGEGFYPASQLAPYTVEVGAILYPPTTILLFLPFLVLPAFLWWAIPLVVIGTVIARHRPNLVAWAAIAVCLAWPGTWWMLAVGNPLLWVTGALALGTVYGWPAAFVLLKPSLFPFALLGVRRRSWWLALGAFAAVSLLFAPMWGDWFASVLNARGPRSGLLYSLGDVPTLSVPLIAWLGRQASRSSASSTLTTSLRPSASALR